MVLSEQHKLTTAAHRLRAAGLMLLITLLLTSGLALAAPELTNATSDLLGALIPGGEITFIAEGTLGCEAELILTIRASGSSTPLMWTSRMQEESDGVYVYRWTVWETVEITLESARVQLTDSSGAFSGQLSAVQGPVAIGCELRGKVSDALTHTPLPGVQVMAYSPSTRHFARAISDRRGDYTLAGLGSAKDYRLWTVNDLGYIDVKKEKLTVNRGGSTVGVDLALTGLSAVSGSVEDDNGLPLSGATVTADQLAGASRQTVLTDEQGRYTIIGLLPGNCELMASRDGAAIARLNIELPDRTVATADFRLRSAPQLVSSEVVFPAITDPAQVLYWPRQGGAVRVADLSATGEAVLHGLTTGEELVLSPTTTGPMTYYSLCPMDQGPYVLDTPMEIPSGLPVGDPWAEQSSALTTKPSVLVVPPLVSRGGSALLSGSASGVDWVDLWLDDSWEARLPVSGGRWQTNVSLDQGEHRVAVTAVGTVAPLKADRTVTVSRTAPTVLQLKVNQQPMPSFFSDDGGGEILTAPQQPLTIALTTTQVGTINWLVLGERQWVMGKLDDTVTATIPADVMVEGEHPLTWRWERQGVRGEVPLGTLLVRKPVTRSFIDAITGDPIPGLAASLEQLTDGGWQTSTRTPFTSDERGQVSMWLGDGVYRLRLSKPSYQAQVISLDPASTTQTTVIPLMPTRPAGSISISPGRGASDVDTSATITVAFARDLAPRSVNANTFYIQGVNAKVDYDPLTRKATLQPIGRLGDDGHYLVHLSGSIRYADGTPLGRDLWWLISTADTTSSEERSGASALTPIGKEATLTPRDSGAKARIPSGSSPVQTLYRLMRPATLPKVLPSGWRPVTAPLSFTATNSPHDKPIRLLQQGAEITIFYTEPPAEGQATTLWRYDTLSSTWVEHLYDHDPYLRTVRFTTDQPGTFVFAQAK